MSATTYQTIDTDYSADTVEWCPVLEFSNVLVCGTYQLLENNEGNESNAAEESVGTKLEEIGEKNSAEDVASSKNRAGRCLMYKLSDDRRELSEVARYETKAILDIKWRREALDVGGSRAALFATVDSVGATVVYKVGEGDGRDYTLTTCASYTNTHFDVNCGTELLNLACEWTHRGESDSKLLVSATDGTVSLYTLRPDSECLIEEKKWLAHSSKYLPAAEAWTCTSDAFNHSLVYSGGEDAKLKCWDLRDGCERPLFTANSHEQGVCSMQSHPTREHVLATGSYDEKVMIWDTRTIKQPLSELDLGGGVWRVKWHPEDPQTILTACIYNNFHIVNATPSFTELNTILSYEDHESLAYGADWQSTPTDATGSTVATCSFYDHKLDLWNYR
eukprot:CFRG1681T1